MTRAALAVAIAAAVGGCASSAGTFVREAHVEGYDLVLERCELLVTGNTLGVRGCVTERRRLPATDDEATGLVVEAVAPDVAVSLPADAVEAGLAPVNASVKACGAGDPFRGTLRVRIVVDASGAVTEVHPDAGGAALGACVTSALAAAHFPATQQGTRVTVTFDLP